MLIKPALQNSNNVTMTGEETINTVEIAKGQFDEGRYSECLTTLNSMKTSTALNIKVISYNS